MSTWRERERESKSKSKSKQASWGGQVGEGGRGNREGASVSACTGVCLGRHVDLASLT